MNPVAATDIDVMKVPVLSTGHISVATRQRFESEGDANPWCHVAGFEYGYFISIPSEWEHAVPPVPADLQALFRWASQRGFAWVRLDSDGEVVDGLPSFSW